MEVNRQHFDFDLQSKFEPKGDQVRAINELTEGINKGEKYQTLLGATGTGKTVTLKVLAEQLSEAGVPVFLSDIKGDLASLAEKGEVTEKIAERLAKVHVEDFEPSSYPVAFWDVFGENGINIRTTISEMGPILLAQLLGLNETQEGILNIAFKVADDQGLLLIDIKDLRAMLNYVGAHAGELRNLYGNIAQQSIGSILRSLLVLEQQGGDNKPQSTPEVPTDNTERKPEVVTLDEQPAKTENTTTKPKASQNILPNTGTAKGVGIFSAAAASILSGLGLVVFGKKEDEESENN